MLIDNQGNCKVRSASQRPNLHMRRYLLVAISNIFFSSSFVAPPVLPPLSDLRLRPTEAAGRDESDGQHLRRHDDVPLARTNHGRLVQLLVGYLELGSETRARRDESERESENGPTFPRAAVAASPLIISFCSSMLAFFLYIYIYIYFFFRFFLQAFLSSSLRPVV